MPVPAPSRRAFLHGCAAGLSLALIRPALAQDAEAPPPLGFRELADGVWLHTSWKKLEQGWVSSNGLAVIGPEEVLLIDTAWSPAQTVALLERLAEAAPNRPVNLVVTHAHDDRLSGLAAVHARGGWSLARDETVKAAEAAGAGTIQRSWSGESTAITGGGRTVELFYPGPAHTRDNTVAFLPDSAVLFGGCVIRAAEQANLVTVPESDVCRWPQSVEAVIARYGKAARIVVPGHGEPGDAGLLSHTHQLAKAEAAKSCSPAG
ncbi:subclass B1 metallo-beta-lactamase [Inquilinus sp. Marseille-Q2685]|uniref:subclass B1 metallo-beta-lactamase n=1 Tax=Inquilinus sp. Marseille-Q2685 TaxID=2866581 RepID=UPI001CE4B112|nr:subclass B1 metallo-beta-lactamase [Inquilinus sp. Marseille-Q2685]